MTNNIAIVSDEALQYGLDIYRDACEESDGIPALIKDCDTPQYTKAKIISLLFSGHTLADCARACGLDPYKVRIMMRHDDAFKAAVELERDMRLSEKADMLERKVWDRAMDGDRKDSMFLAMFALKSKRGEYKDNYSGSSDNRVSVNIEIDGKRFDAKFVPNTDEKEGQQ